jgi:hypothetical protein
VNGKTNSRFIGATLTGMALTAVTAIVTADGIAASAVAGVWIASCRVIGNRTRR